MLEQRTTDYCNNEPLIAGTADCGHQNSGTLCPYYPEPGMFIPISAIFCPYFPMNGQSDGISWRSGENNGINCLYFSQMDGYRWNNGFFCPYFSLALDNFC
ncbi:hypothetical protein P4H42_27455 [Paenibacillus macerans]|uniref:hypothetical protein n=1 Tax=Paenibacillus macerans TaxID=44252 RepID=UPI002DB5AD2F|nr:hypothetical protein [Paenibacillus macerans]MEC0333313.1 hypothetical protein [Paenibacillus macerans]